MDDTDGFVWVEVDTVSLTGMRNPVVSVWVHLEGTPYEDTDAIRVWVTTRYCGDIEILSGVLNNANHPSSFDATTGGTVQIVENSWQRHAVSVAGCGTATVKFGSQTGANSEEVWFDMVEVRDV